MLRYPMSCILRTLRKKRLVSIIQDESILIRFVITKIADFNLFYYGYKSDYNLIKIVPFSSILDKKRID